MANPYKKPWTETVSNRRAGCIERVHVRFGKGWSGTYLQRQRTGRLLHGAIKLVYPSKKGKPVGVLHTPDFFVICQDSCGWIECKMEDHLVQLAEQMPHRYQRKVDGTWRCPPGEEYAQALHFFYRLQSSTQIDWVYQRNLRFLEDYLRASCFPVASQMVQALRLLVMKKPGLTLREVLEGLTPGSADDLYFCIATEQVYVDLAQTPLADPQHVQMFLDREQAQAYVALEQSCGELFPRASSSVVAVRAGTMLWWDGKPWRVLNLGETLVSLLSPEKHVVDLPVEVFEDVLRQRKVTVATPVPEDQERREEYEHVLNASPEQLEVATYRYKLLGRALPEETVVSARTLQRWRTKFRTAEAIYGQGFIGLIPGRNRQGNRLPRLSHSVEHLLEQYITEHYETPKQQSKSAVYLLFEREAREKGLPVPSYRTFLSRIEKRDRREHTLKRQGPRAAAQHDPWVLKVN